MNEPIKPLPNKPEWRAVQSEAPAFYTRVLTHLARQMGEAAAIGDLAQSTLLLKSIHVLRHAYHAELPCVGCRAWMPAAAVDRLTESAMRRLERKP